MPENCPYCKMKLTEEQKDLRICPYCKKVIVKNYTSKADDSSSFSIDFNKISYIVVIIILGFGGYFVYSWLSNFSSHSNIARLFKAKNDFIEEQKDVSTKPKSTPTYTVPSYKSPAVIARTEEFPKLPKCPYKFDKAAVDRFNAALEADRNAELKRAQMLFSVGSYYDSFLLLKKLMADNQKNPYLLLRANMLLVSVLSRLNRPEEYKEAWYNNFYLTEIVGGSSPAESQKIAMAYMKSFDKAQKLLDPEVMKRVKGPIDPMVLKVLKLMPENKEAL